MRRHGFSLVLLLVLVMAGAALAGEGNLRYSISVGKFKNEASWSGRWDLGTGFETIMTAALSDSGKFVVLGDREMRGQAMEEQDLSRSGRTAQGSKTPQVGRMTPAQLLVRGSITAVEETAATKGGIGFRGISLGGSKGSAEINITIYLVDTETGQVKASSSVVGKSGGRGLAVGYHGSALGGLTGNVSDFRKDNMGKAAEDAIAQAVDFLTGQLDSIPWQATVLLVKDDSVILNRGTREGVATGDRFSAGKATELVDPDTGEVLDVDMETVAVLEVSEVKEKIATCRIVERKGELSKGMTVVPAR